MGFSQFLKHSTLLLFFALLACLSSCKRNTEIADISLPPTFIVEAENRFAVVTQPYAILLDEPGEKGITLAHCRRGDVFAVTATRFVGEGNKRSLWVSLEGGWLLREHVVLFSSRSQAEKAAKAMLEEES